MTGEAVAGGGGVGGGVRRRKRDGKENTGMINRKREER